MKKQFRLSLFGEPNKVADNLLLIAAKCNGEWKDKNYSLETLKQFSGETNRENVAIEIIGDHTLHVDVNTSNGWQTICVIEQIEVTELKTLKEIEN